MREQKNTDGGTIEAARSSEKVKHHKHTRDSVSRPGADPFIKLGLSEASAKGAVKAGYEKPTPIQEEVVPVVANGVDVIACSETGSGKTAAFVLPILDLIDYANPHIQAVVLVPTRELCPQVAGEFLKLGAHHHLRVVQVYGGVSYGRQRNDIAKNPQVLVGTPGRVLDLLQSRSLSFKKVSILVLDEADRMLDMGFLPQMKEIIKLVPQERQSLMFSATIPTAVTRLARYCLKNPVNILAGERSRPPDAVEQDAINVQAGGKDERLIETVENEPGSILVFTSTKSRADDVFRTLLKAGHNATVIHSGLDQKERRKAIDGFRSGKFRIMVATDVAQRGLDIDGISLVLNYDLPQSAEDYVHRIGRTGRASAPGRALSFVTVHDLATLRSIEKVTGHTFQNFIPFAKRHEKAGPNRRRLGR